MENRTSQRTLRDYVRVYFTGVAMGAADIIPGVSGGTIAFLMGIYQELLEAIKSFNVEVIRLALGLQIRRVMESVPWQFLLSLGMGILTSVFTLSGLLSYLLEHERQYIFAFFFGLILASVVAVSTRIHGWTVPILGWATAGAVSAFLLVTVIPPGQMGHALPMIFLSGMIAICAMILPGISGSFILLLLGQYEYVLNAVKGLDIKTLIVFTAGCGLGITGFARVLSWMLKHFEQPTIAALIGFMLGSIVKLWPWQEVKETGLSDHAEDFTRPVLPQSASASEILLVLGLCLLGFIVVSFLDHLQSGENPFFRRMERLTGLQMRFVAVGEG